MRFDKYLNRQLRTVKHEHFLPREVAGRYLSSVNRTGGLVRAENWALIREVVEANAKNFAKARAYGPADAVMMAGLAFDADGIPHPRPAGS